MDVPLSEDEQRILRQIEEQLQSDERFAQNTSPAGMYRQSAKTVRWASLGALAGLVFTVVTLSIHFLLAFGGFLVMLACALVIERQLGTPDEIHDLEHAWADAAERTPHGQAIVLDIHQRGAA